MKEANVVLVARGVALYLLCWMCTELTYMPTRILGVYHHLHYTQEHVATAQTYFQDVYVLNFGFGGIRIILLFLAAGWLYRCGPRVKAYFMEPTAETDRKQLSV